MQQYLDTIQRILTEGAERDDRTGVGTVGVFGHQLRFDLQKGFPLVTVKKTFFKGVVAELLWFLRGDTNIKFLLDHGVHIWDDWADRDGNLGVIYGQQWRNFGGTRSCQLDPDSVDTTFPKFKYCVEEKGIDQIADVILRLKTDPYSRRHIVTAWNPNDLSAMSMPPCHCFFQFYVNGNRLHCLFYMRSSDVGLGLPFNIASYALLTHLVAQITGYEVGDLVYMGGDVHIYTNHIEPLRELLQREPYPLPQIEIKRKPINVEDLALLEVSDFALIGYKYHPKMELPIAV